jgi:hypothetical protein
LRMKLTESRSLLAHLASRSLNGLAATASSSVMPLPTMAAMRSRAVAVETAMAVLDINRGIAERSYDVLLPMFSDDGRFNPQALSALSRSYVDLKFLPVQPDMSKLYTEEFLPKK